jgi:hypothetical protein
MIGVHRITPDVQWCHCVVGGGKIWNCKWRSGTSIFLMMMMTMAMAIRRAVGQIKEPTQVKENNLYGQINGARVLTLSPKTITPEP